MQGYHAAWADADIALTQNIFTIFNRWFDLVATWTGGGAEPLPKSEKVVGYEQKVCSFCISVHHTSDGIIGCKPFGVILNIAFGIQE